MDQVSWPAVSWFQAMVSKTQQAIVGAARKVAGGGLDQQTGLPVLPGSE
jgi:hypothetical protein